MIRVGTDSTHEWLIDYEKASGDIQTYTMSALRADVTDGGVLVFTNLNGEVTLAVSPSGWRQVEPR